MGSSAISVHICQRKMVQNNLSLDCFKLNLQWRLPSHSQAVLPAQNLVLDKIEHLDDRFLVDVHVQPAARCPECGKGSGSRRITYLPRLKDPPWQGCALELRLKSWRLQCRIQACVRTIFPLPIPPLA